MSKDTFTKVDSVKGGKQRTPLKAFAKIKKCSSKCPFYNECSYTELAKSEFKEKRTVKQVGGSLKKSVVHILADGKQGLDKEILMELAYHSSARSKSDKACDEYFKKLLMARKAIHGDKLELDAQIENSSIDLLREEYAEFMKKKKAMEIRCVVGEEK